MHKSPFAPGIKTLRKRQWEAEQAAKRAAANKALINSVKGKTK